MIPLLAAILAANLFAPIGIFLSRLGQEIAPARIDNVQELGRIDMPFATLLIDFTVEPLSRAPFTWYFTRMVRRRNAERFVPGAIMLVRFNPLDAVPSPGPVRFSRADAARPARLWLIRGFRPWILAAVASISVFLAIAWLA